MIAPALPITESEVADLVVLHLDRADESSSQAEREYYLNRANFWSDYYLAEYCRPKLVIESTPRTEAETVLLKNFRKVLC